MFIWNALFFLILVGFAYLCLKVIKFPAPIAKYMCLAFDGIVFVMWLLNLVGVGR